MAVLMPLLGARPALAGEACHPAGGFTGPPVRIEASTPSGDIRLTDGRVVRLAYVMTGSGNADPARLATLIGAWRGRDLALRAWAEGRPDRWGRLVVDLADLGSPQPGGAVIGHLGLALLRAGEGLVEPGHPDFGCRAALAAAESEARTRRTGIWSETARIAALKGADGAAVLTFEGRNAVIEGRIVSISERERTVYLNFARRWRDGATVTLSRRLWRDMISVGWNKEAAEGRFVRVRGIVENSNGAVLALSSGAAIEALD
jgi:hypothetical protein